MKKAVDADGAASTIVYSSRGPMGGTIVVSTDPMLRTSTTEANTRKLPVRVSDPMGGALTYQYDAGDRLLALVGPTGAVSRHTYDDVGNRIASVDPDMGAWTYHYDVFGRLVRQQDAKGQIATVEYDSLGRMTKRVQSDSIAAWTYDTAKHGLGKLASVEGSDGYKEEYFYDKLGRQHRAAVRIGTEEFVTSSSFDDFGRVTEAYYPGGFTAVNIYDPKGYLREITDRKHEASFWTLSGTDAFGHTTNEIFGNGIRTTQSFEAETGRIKNIAASQSDGTRVLDLDLKYDQVGSLEMRHEKVVGNKEWFKYDALDRLTQWSRNNGDVFNYGFDAAGRLISKSDAGTYEYGSAPHHAASKIKRGKQTSSFKYDDNANLISGPTGSFEYTSDNRMKLLVSSQLNWTRFDYAPSGNRYRQMDRSSVSMVETLYLGAYERITEHTGRPNVGSLGKMVCHRYYLANGAGVFAAVEANTQYAAVPAALGEYEAPPPLSLGSLSKSKVWYLHKDQLGSVIRITDERRQLHKRYWYDPWGYRYQRDKEKVVSKLGDKLKDSWKRGFTGHEHMDRFGFIHMNGRVANAATGQFTSSDVINQDLSDTQAANAFSYARNNPLKYVDPTGHIFGKLVKEIGNAFRDIGKGIERAFQQVGKWLEENWREVVVAAVVIAVTVFVPIASPVLLGMLAGAVGSGLSTALYGGSLQDVLGSAVKGAVIGGVSAGLFMGVGDVFAANPDSLWAVPSHGAVGGVTESAQGGDFWRGFASASLTKASNMFGSSLNQSRTLSVTKSALVGGTVASISGGKFANGAILGAFSHAFNDLMHDAHQSKLEKFIADLPSIPQDISDAIQGFGSAVSFGLTDWINDASGLQNYVNRNSSAFLMGNISESVSAAFLPAAAMRGAAHLGRLGGNVKSLRWINSNRYVRFGYTRIPDGKPFTYGHTQSPRMPGPTMRIGTGRPAWWNHWDLRVLGK